MCSVLGVVDSVMCILIILCLVLIMWVVVIDELMLLFIVVRIFIGMFLWWLGWFVVYVLLFWEVFLMWY